MMFDGMVARTLGGELYLSSALAKKIYVNVDIPEIAEFKMKTRQAADEASVELLGEMENSQVSWRPLL
ncbi:Replication factor A protein [Corchorus olitorius]|uniref:Replication factor A protein n=1 Tax=Corchorus olitorius TaxID=93759 RepID=A0A1R3IQL9_9ROSI|nr:Replication factor A protein [Corchorus olitorius]